MAASKRRPVALRDIARKAEVSVGTVSNVFAHRSSVSPAMRRAVLEAAEELGYQHRRRDRSHGRADVTMLGMVTRHAMCSIVRNPFYSSVLHGAQAACNELDISLAYEVLSERSEHGAELPRLVQKNQTPGIIVAGYVRPAFLAMLRDSALPFVLVDNVAEPPIADSVCGNDHRGGYLATRHLLDLGHHDPPPAVITGPAHPSVRGRVAGYRQALAEFGSSVPDGYLRIGDLQVEAGRRELRALLDLPTPPTAVFCVNDLTAIGVLGELRDLGFDVPGDFSVVGYDDIDLATSVRPRLTTVRVDRFALAAQAVRYLHERVAAADMPIRQTLLDVELVVRESTGRRKECPDQRLPARFGIPVARTQGGSHA